MSYLSTNLIAQLSQLRHECNIKLFLGFIRALDSFAGDLDTLQYNFPVQSLDNSPAYSWEEGDCTAKDVVAQQSQILTDVLLPWDI